LQFLVALVIAKFLGASGNGSYALFITEASFFILLIGFSFESTITYFVAKKKLDISKSVSAILLLSVFQIFLFASIYFIAYYLFQYHFFIEVNKNNINIGFVFIFSFIISNSFSAILFAHKLFQKYFVGGIFIQIFLLLLLLMNKYVIDYFFFDANAIIVIFTGAAFLQALLAVVLVFYTFGKNFKFIGFKNIIDKEIVNYTLLVFVANVIQFLCYRMDIWFVDFFHTKQAVGQYAFATKIAQLWWVLPQILAAQFFPLLALKEQNVESFKRSIVYLLLISVTSGIIAVLVYPTIVRLTVGNDYIGSYYTFILLLPGVIFFSVNILLATKFSADGNAIYNLKISIACFIIALALNFLLIPKFGIEGAAIGSTIAYSFSSIFAIFKFVYGKKN
jgi:O-antigen/teichoic acid export membrane protein